jgi:4-amino-4-deoxy-L-arabinose transferase-like glycosyltransferase
MNRSTFGKLFPIFLSVLWMFAVTFNYHIVHKPFGSENALAVLNALGDVIVVGAFFALGAALGHHVLRGFEFDSPLEALIFQMGVGLGLLALATFLLGLVVVNRFVFWALLLTAAFLLRDDLSAVWRSLRAIRIPIPSRFERALEIFIALAITLGCLIALMPPIAWDAQTYHLVVPRYALERGQIAAPPDIVYFSFPSLGEMLFLAAMLLKGDSAAQVLHFGFFLLMLGATLAFALHYFTARVAWLAGALLAAVPSLLSVATWAYVDLVLTFYTFMAFYAWMLAVERNDPRWFGLAGALAGFSISVKYTAAIVPLALIGLIMLRRRFDLKALSAFAVGSAVAAPYYIRNWLFTGNPVYPFVFGGSYWDAFRTQWFSRFGTGLMNEPIQLFLAPWNATILGAEGAAGYAATIGPLLLMLLPLLLVARTPHTSRLPFHVSRNLLFFSFCLYLFWLFGVASSKLLLQTRLLFPAFPALSLLGAIAFERLDALDLPQFSLQRFARLVMLLIFGLTGLSYALDFASSDALKYLAGAVPRDAYLTRHLGGYYVALKFVNANLPKDARVFFLWEPRSYYAERSSQPDAILDAWAHLRWRYRDADSIAAALRARGYTHVFLSRAGLDFMLQTGDDPISLEDVQVLEEFAARHLRQEYGKAPLRIITRAGKPGVLDAVDDPYAIYRLDAAR